MDFRNLEIKVKRREPTNQDLQMMNNVLDQRKRN